MWQQFRELGVYESHVLDTTTWDVARTVREVHALVRSTQCRLDRESTAP